MEEKERYDVIIVGAGMAGLSAALTLRLHGLKVLWLGTPLLSEKIRRAEKIENYPGLPSVSGEAFAAALRDQAERAGLSVTPQTATGVYAMGGYLSVSTEKESFEGRAVILATGVESVKSAAGEEAFLGRGVSYCATCDGALYRGKTIAVVCTSKEKEGEAAFLASLAAKVYFVPLYKDPSFAAPNVEYVGGMPLKIEGKRRAEKLVFKDRELSVDGIFFLKSARPPAALVGGLKTEGGHVAVGRDMSTNLKGLFAAGEETVVDLLQSCPVSNAMGDDGVPLQTGVELSIGGPTQDVLCLIQGGAQGDAQAQQPIPGGVPTAGEHLINIDLAHIGPAGQDSFGNRVPGMYRLQQILHIAEGKEGLVLLQIGVQVGLGEHLPAQIARGLGQQRPTPFTFQMESDILSLQYFAPGSKMQRA